MGLSLTTLFANNLHVLVSLLALNWLYCCAPRQINIEQQSLNAYIKCNYLTNGEIITEYTALLT